MKLSSWIGVILLFISSASYSQFTPEDIAWQKSMIKTPAGTVPSGGWGTFCKETAPDSSSVKRNDHLVHCLRYIAFDDMRKSQMSKSECDGIYRMFNNSTNDKAEYKDFCETYYAYEQCLMYADVHAEKEKKDKARLGCLQKFSKHDYQLCKKELPDMRKFSKKIPANFCDLPQQTLSPSPNKKGSGGRH